jgi:hypothetical protein
MRKLLILIVAGAFVLGYTVSALAQAEWSFSGSSRVETMMNSLSKEASGLGFDDDDLFFAQNIVSNIMATVTAGDVGGGIQYWQGLYGPEFAQIYGTWNFGAGTLLVGRSFTPANIFISNQVWGHDADMLWWGTLYMDTEPMLQLSTRPDNDDLTGVGVDTDTSMPKLEASYSFNVGPVALTVLGAYQSFDEVSAADKEYSIDSYVVGLVAKIGLGAAYINADVYTAQNLQQIVPHGEFLGANASADYVLAVKDDIIDNDALAYCLVVGYTASPMLKFEAGYGSLETELDRPGTWEDEASAYYVNCQITLAPGVTVTPEIGKIDNKDRTEGGVVTPEGDTTYWGAKWMINF